MTMEARTEAEESLLTLVAPPLLWAAHFLLSYGTAALHCAKLAEVGGSLGAARWVIVAYTVVALALVGWLGWRGYERRRSAAGSAADSAPGGALARQRFLGFTTALLAGLSALAIVYGALVLAFVRSCR